MNALGDLEMGCPVLAHFEKRIRLVDIVCGLEQIWGELLYGW